MWFRVQLEGTSPLAALVGGDGTTVYWRVCDLARLLQITNSYAFVRSTLRGERVFHGRNIASPPLSPKTERTLVVTTDVLLRTLQRQNVALAQQLSVALERGRAVVHQKYLSRFLFNPLYSPLLAVYPEGDTSVAEWIESFCTEWAAQVESTRRDNTGPATNFAESRSENGDEVVYVIPDNTGGPSRLRQPPPPTVYRAKPVTVNTFKRECINSKNSKRSVYGKLESEDWLMVIDDDDITPNKIHITHGPNVTVYVQQTPYSPVSQSE